jgi:hypothetical protein
MLPGAGMSPALLQLVQVLLNLLVPVHHFAALVLDLGGHAVRCRREYGGRVHHLRWVWLCR